MALDNPPTEVPADAEMRAQELIEAPA